MDRVAVFTVVLFGIQTLQGTAIYFSVGTMAFLLIAAMAFNAGGGLTRAPGAYVFFYSMLVFVVGIVHKAMLWEPAESNLRVPKTTIEVYVAGISAMFAAVLLSRRLSRKTGLLQNMLKERQMYRATVGCIVFGIGGPYMIGMLGSAGARVNSAFTQLNQLLPLAIIVGTMYEMRRSGGKRSINAPVAFTIAHMFFFYGLIGFSKQGMLEPVYCWLLAAAAMRYRLSSLQLVSLGVWVMIVFGLLVPYSQWGRRFTTQGMSFSQKFALSVSLLSDPADLRRNYAANQQDDSNQFRYYNTPQGFWDRLQFISTDDSLNEVTARGNTFGYMPVTMGFMNAVPRVFFPNKPTFNFGNMYAHEIGGLPEEDTSTGISFSPTAEAFHLDSWVGLLVAAPLIWLLVFFLLDLLCGDLRASPWGLLVIAIMSHVAPEQGISGCIYLATFTVEGIIFCAFFTSYVAPFFSIAVLGEARPKPAPFRRPVGLGTPDPSLGNAE